MHDDSPKETFNVLFVDDEENVLRALKRLFIDNDTIEIFTACSGREGLEILKTAPVSVIVSDQRMPEMNGAEFLEKASRQAPDSVRIVLTGYADINAAMDAVNKGGIYRYITKPWNDNEFILTVRDAIERYRLVTENKYRKTE
jgi:response regulator RpfG family c-di-GMP phosphodiesterase